MTQLRPILTEEHRQALVAAARAQGHAVPFATHLGVSAGRVVAGASLGAMPTINLWVDERLAPRQTLEFWQQVEAVLAAQRIPGVVVVCSDDSPLKPYLERVASGHLGTFHLYHVPLETTLTTVPVPPPAEPQPQQSPS